LFVERAGHTRDSFFSSHPCPSSSFGRFRRMVHHRVQADGPILTLTAVLARQQRRNAL